MKRSIKSLLASIFVSLFPVSPAVAGPYEDGLAAYNRGDYATALRLFPPLAEQGNALAQRELGVMFYEGKGVKQDDVKAHKWLKPQASSWLTVQAASGNARVTRFRICNQL
jgi:hypothetical protein